MAVFPQVILPLKTWLNIGGWTDVSSMTYQRDGSVLPNISRGRTDQAATASPQTMTCQLNNRDGRFSPRNPVGPYYGTLPVRNCPIRMGVTTPNTYLRLADDAASNCQTTSISLGANIEVRWFGKLDSHQSCVLASTWTTATNHRSWALTLNGDGTLSLFWSTDGSSVNALSSTPGLPVPLGTVLIRCNINTSTQTVTFYTGSVMGVGTQFGSAITGGPASLHATALAKLAVGYSSDFVNDSPPSTFTYAGCTGEIYEFQLYNLITLVADPIFTSEPAGTTTFSDVQGNSWSTTGTAEISATSYRFHGEIAGLPQNWDATGLDVWSPLQCAGMFRRIQQNQVPLRSSVGRAVLQQPNLVAYWPFEDVAGSGQGATGLSSSANYPMLQVSGSPNWANDTSVPGSNPLLTLNNAQLIGKVAGYTDLAAGSFIARGLLNIPTSFGGTNEIVAILGLYCAGSFGQIYLLYNPAQGLYINYGAASAINGGTSASPQPITQGQTFLFSVELAASGGNVVPTLRTMPINSITVTSTIGGSQAGKIGAVTAVSVAPFTEIGVKPGQIVIGHVWLQETVSSTSAQAMQLLQPALVGHPGETAGNRFIRLCQENNLAYRHYGYPNLTAPMGVQSPGTLMALLQECETADMGLLYESRRALAVGYRSLKSLQSQGNANNPAVQLSYSAARLGDGQNTLITPTDDDTFLRNDIQVTKGNLGGATGSFYIAQLNDGSPMSISPPPTGAGDYQSQVTANTFTETQLRDIAWWLLHIGTDNEERIPNIPLQLARPQIAGTGLIWTIAQMDVGDMLQITNVPAFLPPGPLNFLVLGGQETLGGYLWSMVLNAVPETPYEVAIIGDAVMGHVQTDGGSQVNTGFNTTATSLSVKSSGVVWTQAAGDFPFDIIISGERMTVTNITGASSPQTFTVTRSVNGIVKSHLANEPVALFFPPVIAIQ